MWQAATCLCACTLITGRGQGVWQAAICLCACMAGQCWVMVTVTLAYILAAIWVRQQWVL